MKSRWYSGMNTEEGILSQITQQTYNCLQTIQQRIELTVTKYCLACNKLSAAGRESTAGM